MFNKTRLLQLTAAILFIILLLYLQTPNLSHFVLHGNGSSRNNGYLMKFRNVTNSSSHMNRTHPNTSLVIYNRAGKAGSSTMLYLIQKLSTSNNFTLLHSNDYRHRQIPEEEQIDLMNYLLQLPPNTVFDRHVYFLNFSKVNVEPPAYINLVRNPVDMEVSRFFYNRSEKHWKVLEKLFPDDLVRPPEKWFTKDINEAILDPDDVQFGRFKDGSVRESLVAYFCGQERFCKFHNDKKAIQQAKSNIDLHYVWVGVLEKLQDSLKVLEAYLPKFFRGILKLYNPGKTQVNVGSNKKNVTHAALRRLRMLTAPDQHLYDFVLQRLKKQINYIGAQ